jgi:hypothetical protein
MAKTITPINVWVNGQNKQAKILDSYVTRLTLNQSARFYWAIFVENTDGTQGEQVAEGNLSMEGVDYQSWEQDTYAWDYISSKLNLTLTGEFVPPVQEQNP